jgi:hypothetical protein
MLGRFFFGRTDTTEKREEFHSASSGGCGNGIQWVGYK